LHVGRRAEPLPYFAPRSESTSKLVFDFRTEVQQLHKQVAAQQIMLTAQAQQLAEIDSLKQQCAEMQTELAELRTTDTRVARR
jgi:hypothetical protein